MRNPLKILGQPLNNLMKQLKLALSTKQKKYINKPKKKEGENSIFFMHETLSMQ